MIQGDDGIGKSFVLKKIILKCVQVFKALPVLYLSATEECGIESFHQLCSEVAEQLDLGKDSAVLSRYESTEIEKQDCLYKILNGIKTIIIDDADANNFKLWTFLSTFISEKKLKANLLGSKLIAVRLKGTNDVPVIHTIKGLTPQELFNLYPIHASLDSSYASHGNPSIFQMLLKLAPEERRGIFADEITTVVNNILMRLKYGEVYFLSQIALCRKPIPLLKEAFDMMPHIVSYGLIERSESQKCNTVWFKNCIRRAVLKLIPSLNVPSDIKETYHASELWEHLLHIKLQELLSGAKDRNWPYIPESWQFVDCVKESDMYNLRDLLNKPNRFADVKQMREIDVIQECLYHCLIEKNYANAAAVVFLIDRYAFWKGDSKGLLKIVDFIQTESPDTPIAPQILTRKARVLKNDGDLQGAERLLDMLINNDQSAGSWKYKDVDEYLIIKAASIELKGNIYHGLGLWEKAASSFMESTNLFKSFKKPDKKGIAAGLAAMADTLQSMPDNDFQSFAAKFQLSLEHRLLQAIKCVTEAANFCLFTPLFYSKNKRRAAELTLAYTSYLKDQHDEISKCLENAAYEARESLKCHKSINRLESREQFYEFVCCIFRLSQICCRLFPAKNYNAAIIFDNLSKKLFAHYCTYSQKVKHSKEFASTINNCMKLLGLEEIPWVDETKSGDDDLPNTQVLTEEDEWQANMNLKEIAPTPNDDSKMQSSVENSLKDDASVTSPQSIHSLDTSDSIYCHEESESMSRKNGEMVRNDGSCELESSRNQKGNWLSCFTTAEDETVERRNFRVQLTLATLESAGKGGQEEYKSEMRNNKVYNARVWRYDPSTEKWKTMETLAYLGDKKDFGEHSGACRNAYEFEYLNQEETQGRYLGKQYKLEKYRPGIISIEQYKQDVICQTTARFYGALFNQKLYSLGLDKPLGQVQFLPTVLVELTDVVDDRQRYFNVEPFMNGNFAKITNNSIYVTKKGSPEVDLLLAFSHFTYHESKGKLVVVDIQGWTSQYSQGFHYLTDPQIHTGDVSRKLYGTGNLGMKGMKKFWKEQHKACNEVCKKLELERPSY